MAILVATRATALLVKALGVEPSDPLFPPFLGSLIDIQGSFRPIKTHAAVLIKAAARGAATLVEVNVRLGKLDGDWLDRSAAYLAAADGCRDAAAFHRTQQSGTRPVHG